VTLFKPSRKIYADPVGPGHTHSLERIDSGSQAI
jgi:hypothetical protein